MPKYLVSVPATFEIYAEAENEEEAIKQVLADCERQQMHEATEAPFGGNFYVDIRGDAEVTDVA